jgi:hypothetical protein
MKKSILGMMVLILGLIWLVPFMEGNANAEPITLKVSKLGSPYARISPCHHGPLG